MELLYGAGEIGWMTGVIIVGVIYAAFALIWGKGKFDDDDKKK